MDLLDLKAFLDDVVDSFAAVLDLELTIINTDPMLRISGTGRFRGRANEEDNWERSYTLQVMQSGEPALSTISVSRRKFVALCITSVPGLKCSGSA